MSEPAAGSADEREIVIVSGLPRSGTSMMMRMLDLGGLPPLSDGVRESDEDNPKGYYEFERVKQLDKGDHAWLAEAPGKAVKVISALLLHLPPTYRYRVIFMQREMTEILASQRKMLIRRGEDPNAVADEVLRRAYDKHLAKVKDWLERDSGHFSVLYVSYNELIGGSRTELERVAGFVGRPLDVGRMATAIDPALYRQRASNLPG